MSDFREYKHKSSAHRAGRRDCLENGHRSYLVAFMGDYVLAVGLEQNDFEEWLKRENIPVSKNDIERRLVYR